jgi:toxin CptA
MTHSLHSSSASVSCRLDWRPSRWLIGALLLLAVLASVSIMASDMPQMTAWPLAIIALAYGGWQARAESRKRHREFVFPGNDLPVMLDGRPVEAVVVQWRGPLAFVSWRGRGGRRERLAWWPDTLSAARRRELRLAAGAADATRQRALMAP